jgi:hypothetical protein
MRTTGIRTWRRFQTEGPAPILFLATNIVTGVKSCKPQQLIG